MESRCASSTTLPAYMMAIRCSPSQNCVSTDELDNAHAARVPGGLPPSRCSTATARATDTRDLCRPSKRIECRRQFASQHRDSGKARVYATIRDHTAGIERSLGERRWHDESPGVKSAVSCSVATSWTARSLPASRERIAKVALRMIPRSRSPTGATRFRKLTAAAAMLQKNQAGKRVGRGAYWGPLLSLTARTLPQQRTRHHHAVNFRGALADAPDAQLTVSPLERHLLGDAERAEDLDTAVDYFGCDFGRVHLGDRCVDLDVMPDRKSV